MAPCGWESADWWRHVAGNQLTGGDPCLMAVADKLGGREELIALRTLWKRASVLLLFKGEGFLCTASGITVT